MTTDYFEETEKRAASVLARHGFTPRTIAMVKADPVRLWTRQGDRESAPEAYVSAGIHGDELCGSEALLHWLETRELPAGFHWVVAPFLNPSGLRQGTRENARGIDLNRDFFRKRSAEIRAFTGWWRGRGRGCDLHFSLHEDWEAEGFYLYEINTGPWPSIGKDVLDRLVDDWPLQAGGPVDGHDLDAPGLILHAPEPDEEEGWPEAIWLAKSWPVLSCTFEAPGRLRREARIALLADAFDAALSAVTTEPEPGNPGQVIFQASTEIP